MRTKEVRALRSGVTDHMVQVYVAPVCFFLVFFSLLPITSRGVVETLVVRGARRLCASATR